MSDGDFEIFKVLVVSLTVLFTDVCLVVITFIEFAWFDVLSFQGLLGANHVFERT
jgi:hypothetical protein